MNWKGVLLFAVVLLAMAASKGASQDPAGSWMAYAENKGHGARLTYVNTTLVVPPYPSTMEPDSAPGWWLGIENAAMMNLIQPILAWGYADCGACFSVFDGYFEWDNGDWEFTNQIQVQPGDVVDASIRWDANNATYEQCIGVRRQTPVCFNIALESPDMVYTNLVFVMEHQPDDCSVLPTSKAMLFSNIHVEYEGKPVTPAWTAQQFQPACDSNVKIVDPRTIQFTWSNEN